MEKNLGATSSIAAAAPTVGGRNALVNPAAIEQYILTSPAALDWRDYYLITRSGIWDGRRSPAGIGR